MNNKRLLASLVKILRMMAIEQMATKVRITGELKVIFNGDDFFVFKVEPPFIYALGASSLVWCKLYCIT